MAAAMQAAGVDMERESAAEASYNTILRTGYGTCEEKRSRFLGEAIPIRTAEEAAAHLSRIRKEYYDARHHCNAFVLGQKREVKKASDDGEPSGTAGLPILKVIEGRSCTNLLVVVTRYFGGTLLGTGGLVRAYTAAAQRALEDAGVVCMRAGETMELVMDYSFLSAVQYYLEKTSIQTAGIDYADRVVCRVIVPSQQCSAVRDKMQVISGGKIAVRTLEKGFYGFAD